MRRKNADGVIQSDLTLEFPLGPCKVKLEFDGMVTENSLNTLVQHLEITKKAVTNGTYGRRKDDDLTEKLQEAEQVSAQSQPERGGSGFLLEVKVRTIFEALANTFWAMKRRLDWWLKESK